MLVQTWNREGLSEETAQPATWTRGRSRVGRGTSCAEAQGMFCPEEAGGGGESEAITTWRSHQVGLAA